MILDVEKFQMFHRKLLKLMNVWARSQDTRTNIEKKVKTQKSSPFLSTRKEQSETKKTVLFIIASENLKKLRNKFSKETQISYTEIYKSCWEEGKKSLNKWRQMSCSWVGRISIARMTVLPKLIYIFNALPLKIQGGIFNTNWEVDCKR